LSSSIPSRSKGRRIDSRLRPRPRYKLRSMPPRLRYRGKRHGVITAPRPPDRAVETMNKIDAIIKEGTTDQLNKEPPSQIELPYPRKTSSGFERITVRYPGTNPQELRRCCELLLLQWSF
jgi:hypothetical protein